MLGADRGVSFRGKAGMNLLSEPLLHFVVGGTILFAGLKLVPAYAPDTIAVLRVIERVAVF
jgi:hypothetical protein